VTFISIHSVIIYVVFFGACMRCTRLCPLKLGVTEVVSEEMLTVGRNLDRNGHNHYLLTLLWFFLYLSWSFSPSTVLLWLTLPMLLWYFSKFILIFSHLFPLYFNYSCLFPSKDKCGFHTLNLCAFRNRRPTPRNKNKTIFIGIYTLECLFLWYLADLDLWLSVMGCGVMSTITSANTYRLK
jgi:hypothetical protein